MDKVLENADEFREIREVMARYDTLTATHLVGLIILPINHKKSVLSTFNNEYNFKLRISATIIIIITIIIIYK